MNMLYNSTAPSPSYRQAWHAAEAQGVRLTKLFVPARYPLVYAGPGVYVPVATAGGIEWRRDTTGDPLYGVEVPDIMNVNKFAELARVERMEEER